VTIEKFKLKATPRDSVGRKVRALRRTGLIPAVLYGRGKDSLNLSITEKDYIHLYREAGTSSIVLLDIEGEGQKNVLVQDIQFDALTGNAVHIDFYEVSMTEKLTTMVPLHFVGDSAAVIDLSGSLTTNTDEVEVECLPGDLPHEIEVDISILSDFEAVIHVSDLKLPAGVEVKNDPEDVVATVEPPRSEEEMAELDEDIEAPELPEAEKGGDEAPAEEGAEEAPAEEAK
jgi:large subunit ribosomal protein L25